MAEESLWEDWESITEEEISQCFEGLDEWSGISCDVCEAIFPTVRELKKHGKVHKLPSPTEQIDIDRIMDILKIACRNCHYISRCGPRFEELDLNLIVPLVKRLNAVFCDVGTDGIYQYYSNICQQASKLLGLQHQLLAASLLVKIVDALVQAEEKVSTARMSGINSRESDNLEYIGGVLLHSLSTKSHKAVAACLSEDAPTGQLIQIMERKHHCLKYPSDKFKGVIMRFYCFHSRERFKPASQVDFLQLVDEIHQDPWYRSLIENVVMQTGECDSYVEDVLDMTMKHLNRILTHPFHNYMLLCMLCHFLNSGAKSYFIKLFYK